MPIHPTLDFMFGEWGGGGAQTIDFSGNGIASAEAFGTAKLNQNIQAAGIASAEAFGITQITLQEDLFGAPINVELFRRKREKEQLELILAEDEELFMMVASTMEVVKNRLWVH